VVFFNYTTMQVSAKIVYYGPGLCGKTTNLHQIHGRTDPSSRGEMVSLETEADRTLFFDLLPLEVGTIGGMRVRLQLYTVPGQVFYNTTRKLVLKGVDGIVFVADSQEPMLDANVESLNNLKKNLAELNQPFDRIPFIFQYNKRDLRNIHSVDTLNRHLNRESYDVYEGAALHGVGVFETLKAISRKTLLAVHRKISGEEEPPPRPPLQEKAPEKVPEKVQVPVGAPEAAEEAELAAAIDSNDAPPSAPTTSEFFAELEDDLDPNAVAITPRSSEVATEVAVEEAEPSAPVSPVPEVESVRSDTAEVHIEFAANPEVEVVPEADAKATAEDRPRVATKSRMDIERELESLRAMAFGASRDQRDAQGSETLLSARGDALVPRSALEKASGLVVDLRLVAEGMSHPVPGVVRIELPPHRKGAKARLKLEIELQEDGED
jgi:hypothetical protein